MLIAIAIAEEIQGLQRVGKLCKFWASEFSSTLASFSALWETSCQSRRQLRSSKLVELLCNPLLSLDLFCNFTPRDAHCYWKISLLVTLILQWPPTDLQQPPDDHPWPPLTSHWPPRTPHWPPMTSHWPPMTSHCLWRSPMIFFNFRSPLFRQGFSSKAY